jgi:hypothetical protein
MCHRIVFECSPKIENDYSEDPTESVYGDSLMGYVQVFGNEEPDFSFWVQEATKQFGITSVVEYTPHFT